ncbi:hypothetical protein [Streptomyces sp. NPDC058964]|uniref:hypothetical protein n=1 Tax=Streptomyces sp. NPDC058964 TaxID=3346681 RepID=UPI0036B5E872
MLHDTLVAESRRNDSLDVVRSAALHRVRWLVDLLARRRTEFRRCTYDGHQRYEAAGAVTRAEIDRRLTACADGEGRAAVLCLLPAAYDTGHWFASSLGPVPNAAEQLDADGRRAVMPWPRHAFLLAADTRITDKTILRQIKRGT